MQKAPEPKNGSGAFCMDLIRGGPCPLVASAAGWVPDDSKPPDGMSGGLLCDGGVTLRDAPVHRNRARKSSRLR